MWIMIAGPYTAGAADESQRQANLDAMNRAAYEVFLRGHIPIIGMTTNPNQQFHADAIAAGASVVAMESGILAQLPQLLDMALAVD